MNILQVVHPCPDDFNPVIASSWVLFIHSLQKYNIFSICANLFVFLRAILPFSLHLLPLLQKNITFICISHIFVVLLRPKVFYAGS